MFVDLSGQVNQEGLYCPPPQFVTDDALTLMKRSIKNGGFLIFGSITLI
jgi:hypothetical protein